MQHFRCRFETQVETSSPWLLCEFGLELYIENQTHMIIFKAKRLEGITEQGGYEVLRLNPVH